MRASNTKLTYLETKGLKNMRILSIRDTTISVLGTLSMPLLEELRIRKTKIIRIDLTL